MRVTRRRKKKKKTRRRDLRVGLDYDGYSDIKFTSAKACSAHVIDTFIYSDESLHHFFLDKDR